MAGESTSPQSTQNTQKQRDPATARILAAYFALYHELGWGFLETVYRRAMVVGLQRLGASVRQEVRISVRYLGAHVGEYYADLIVDESVVVEIKAVDRLGPSHRAQLLNYLKASGFHTGLLVNFGPRPSFERLVNTPRVRRA
jgi:GxxExxY protein